MSFVTKTFTGWTSYGVTWPRTIRTDPKMPSVPLKRQSHSRRNILCLVIGPEQEPHPCHLRPLPR